MNGLGKRLAIVIPICALVLGYALISPKIKTALKDGLKGVSTEKEEGKGSESLSSDEALAVKLDPYIWVLNTVDNQVQLSYEQYLGWVDSAHGPSAKLSYIGTINEPWGLDQAADSIRHGLALEPKLAPIDAAGKAYGDALAALAPLLKQAHDYYDQKDYKDDNFAKGASLHAPLLTAFASYHSASAAFREAVGKEHEGLSERELVAIEKSEGRSLVYFHKKMMLDAKKLADIVESAAVMPEKSSYQGALEVYTKSLDEAKGYAVAHADEIKESKSSWQSIENDADALLRQAKELSRYLRDGKTPDNDMSEGSPREFMRAFNSLVSASNIHERWLR
jgi:hypothetical protein